VKTDSVPSLQVKKSFTASAESVFDAWIDPDKARKFLFATSTGEVVRCEIDARVGGKFTITRRDPSEDGDIDHVGEYEVIDRPRRLVFTFGVPKHSEEFTRVAIEITPTGTGCNLTLTHEGVPSEWSEQTLKGWTMILDNQATTLT
jgi:uncharacterized protein YndB with AHSA1/START domain